MAKKSKVLNTKKVLDGVSQRFRSVVNSKQFKDAAKETVIEQSKAQARSGKNPTTLKANKKIGSNWHFWRQDIESQNRPLSEFYKPSSRKSTLSYTGQLVESTRAVAASDKNKGSLRIRLFVSGNPRKPYKGIKGKPYKKATNKEIVEGQQKQGRSLLGISNKVVKTIRTQFLSALRRKS